jgi:glycosyltransferase involved in cell wall biosynthesis
MLVSVIVPTYQRAHVLPGAIRSILGQEGVALELIIIDDGSTDETAGVVARFDDPRVRYVRFERNRGIGAARHAGVSEAQGEIVAFLDSDDLWKPGKLARLTSAFERHHAVDVAFSDYENINHLKGTRERGFQQTASAFRLLRVAALEPGWWTIETGIPEALLRANFIGTCSIVALRRQVFERSGNFLPELHGPEDLEMWWRAALGGAGFAYTDEVLVERHKSGESITADVLSYVPRYLQALQACEATARSVGRRDLLPHLRRARQRAWSSAVAACGSEGRRREAMGVFLGSLRHGVSLASLRELGAALSGPRARSLWRRLRGAPPGS